MDATSLTISSIPPRNSDATVVWAYLERSLSRLLAHGLTAISPIEYYSAYQVVYNFCREHAMDSIASRGELAASFTGCSSLN